MLASKSPQRLYLTPLAQWIAETFDLPWVIQPERSTWIPLPPVRVKDAAQSKDDEDEIQVLSVTGGKIPPGGIPSKTAHHDIVQVAQAEGEIASESSDGMENPITLKAVMSHERDGRGWAKPSCEVTFFQMIGSAILASLETISLSSSNGPQSPEPFLDEPVEVDVPLDENENLKEDEGQFMFVDPVDPNQVPSESKEQGRKKSWTPIEFFSCDKEANQGKVEEPVLPVEPTEIFKKKPRSSIKFVSDDKDDIQARVVKPAIPLESSEKFKQKSRTPLKFNSSDNEDDRGMVGEPELPTESMEKLKRKPRVPIKFVMSDNEDRQDMVSEPKIPLAPSEIFKKKPRTAVKFISPDNEENQDNVDAGWDELRNLRDEEECKRYGLKKLGLSFNVDPTQSYSYHGFRRKLLAEQFGIGREWSDAVRKSIRDRSSLMIQNGVLRNIHGYRTSPVETVGSKRGRDCNSWEEPPTKRIRFSDFEQEFLKTIYELKFPLMSPREEDARRQVLNWERYLRHFRDGMSESELFLRFYDKSARLSEQECRANIDTEMLYYQFTQFYGVNPEVSCKDCAYYERSLSLVKHPF